MIKNFYDAWWFLENHLMFKDEHENSRAYECIDIHVAKVNPLTCSVDENDKLNTKVEVWLEAGKYDKECNYHDLDLDIGGDTYEEAIIKLANNVFDQYGSNNERIKPNSY